MNTVRPEYVVRFDEMLRSSEILDSILSDLQSIENLDVDATEREVLALARVGQGVFRANVIEAWGLGEVCAVTGTRLRSLLIASHVRPWRDCRTRNERLDGANGILLCAHLDRLFDQGFVSFTNDGGIVFGRTLQEDIEASTDLAMLGVTPQSRLNLAHIDPTSYERLAEYLSDHRACLR
jgi:predicted restriction endonuclease